jgi:hypothetical protein
MLFPPSDEQTNIVNLVKENNVIVEAVAGSGKTTTAIYIAKTYPEKQILLLTYSKHLKFESKRRVDALLECGELKSKNIDIFSFHSFGTKFYTQLCADDKGLKEINQSIPHPNASFSYDIIIIDEAQDINPLIYQFLINVIYNNQKPCILCILGDPRQSIFNTINDSDERFLTFADNIFNTGKNSSPWQHARLSTSYRLTTEMADYINKRIAKNPDYIRTSKVIAKSVISIEDKVIINSHDSMKTTINKISELLKTYKFDDIFILAPSIRSDRESSKWKPPVQVVNAFKREKIPFYIPLNDDSPPNKDQMKGKIAILSFHQSKGLERKITIVLGYDASYFKYYAKDVSPFICPNPLYVAITRASERLILVSTKNQNPLPFLCGVDYRTEDEKSASKPRVFAITDLTRFIPRDLIDTATDLVIREQITTIEPKDTSVYCDITTSKGLVEDVSDINGVLFPAYYEFARTKKLFGEVLTDDEMNDIKSDDKIGRFLIDRSIDYLVKSTYKNRRWQIDKVDRRWISKDQLQCYKDVMDQFGISDNSRYEVVMKPHIIKNMASVVGRMDCVDYSTGMIWEFKFVKELRDIHLLQLAFYCAIEGRSVGRLANISNGEIYEINIDVDTIKTIITRIVEYKCRTGIIIDSNEEFTEKRCVEHRNIFQFVTDGEPPQILDDCDGDDTAGDVILFEEFDKFYYG